MFIVIAILSIILVIFEVSLREITILSNICLLFITIHILFWFKRYTVAFICGVAAGIFIDLVTQNHIGRLVISLFAPLILLSFFDNLLQFDNTISRVIFSVISVLISIFISDILFELVFWKGNLVPILVVKRMIISGVITLVVSMLIGKYILRFGNGKKGEFRIKSR